MRSVVVSVSCVVCCVVCRRTEMELMQAAVLGLPEGSL